MLQLTESEAKELSAILELAKLSIDKSLESGEAGPFYLGIAMGSLDRGRELLLEKIKRETKP